MSLIEQLKRHEGFRGRPYRDTVGKLTIGYGWNIDDVPLSQSAAEFILKEHVMEAFEECRIAFPWFHLLSEARREVIVNMVFNMGLPRVQGFKKMIAAIEAEDWEEASKQMLQSKWAVQVGDRARELAAQMKNGFGIGESNA